MRDSYLLDAGWLFFAAWGVVVLLVSWKAFRSDLFAARASINSGQKFAALPGEKKSEKKSGDR
jgi:hypothetical protein